MIVEELSCIHIDQRALEAKRLKRLVLVDFYVPRPGFADKDLPVLIINDGQDLETMNFGSLVNDLIEKKEIKPVLVAAVHAGRHRRHEYGTARELDYEGRGTLAAPYQQFISTTLLSYIRNEFGLSMEQAPSIAGFSLGGLSALDTAWNGEGLFSKVGVFSGSLWWRSHALGKGYNDDQHRIMHRQIREGRKWPMKFYFTTGSLDEAEDRNGNGIIDSIDDTLDLIHELKLQGYREEDFQYINYEEGKHDVATWKMALPAFLKWGWGIENA